MNDALREDRKIVVELESGDLVRMKAAIKQLQRKYENKVTRWIFGRCGWLTPTELADVWEEASEDFVIYAAAGKVTALEASLVSLLKAIAYRRAVDVGRKRPDFHTTSLDQIPESVVPSVPGGAIEVCDLFCDLLVILETFPRIRRQVWLAFAESGFAVALDDLVALASARAGKRLNEDALKHHLDRGRKVLAFWLDEHYPNLASSIRRARGSLKCGSSKCNPKLDDLQSKDQDDTLPNDGSEEMIEKQEY